MTTVPDTVLENLPDEAFYAIKIAEAISQLNAFYVSSAPVPTISWDLNGKSRLGEASGDGSNIRLNPQYAAAMGRKVYLQTALHEACHIVTTWRCNDRGARRESSGQWSSHGYQWARAMEVLGLAPNRCASPSAEVSAAIKPSRIVRKVHASCACASGHEITLTVARKITSGARYTCRGCRQPIVISA